MILGDPLESVGNVRQAILYRTVPLAVLLLMLILLVAYHSLPTASKGLRVGIAPDTCVCYSPTRTILLHISGNGELSLNADPVEMKTLAHHLSDIYSTRAERVRACLAPGPGAVDIDIRLVTPGAVEMTCPKDCYNWGKHGLLVSP